VYSLSHNEHKHDVYAHALFLICFGFKLKE
jgi:hypothetical protein